MSSPSTPSPETSDPRSLPPVTREVFETNMASLHQEKRARVASLIEAIEEEDFWTKSRYCQVIEMLNKKNVYRITQTVIAGVLGVSNSLVTRYKQFFEEHPEEETRPAPGRSSQLTVVFPSWKKSSPRKPKRTAPSR